jgi:DICT domain-containing protein
MQRRRFKGILSFPDDFAKEAARLREEAEALPYSPERDALLKKARQAATAAHVDEWLSSPELRPPD